MSRGRGDHGFTLIEVLVALVIVALGIAAVMSALLGSASGTERLRERALAEWVAANRIGETRLAQDFPAIGRSDGVASMGGRDWKWQQEIRRTAVEGLVQIVVDVRPADSTATDGWLVTLRGARGRDVVANGDADALWDTAVRSAP
jgi:general secretion pathway protein I